MLLCMYYLQTAYNKLLNTKDKLEAEVEITDRRKAEGKTREFEGKTIITTVSNLFLDIAMVLEETKNLERYYFEQFIDARNHMHNIADKIENAKTAKELLSAVNDIVSDLSWVINRKVHDDIRYYNYSYDFKDKWGDRSYTCDSVDPAVVRKIANAVKWPPRTVNIFEMFVRNDRIVNTFKQSEIKQKDNANFYGLDIDDNVSNGSVRACFKRLIYGKIKGSVITNGCFDIIFCAPPISINKEIVGGQFVKRERELLFKTVDYLRSKGVLVFALPYYRFYTEICAFLIKNYDNLQIFADGRSDLAYVVGTKREKSVSIASVKTNDYVTLRNLPLCFSKLPWLPDINLIDLQPQSLEVKRFRGSKLNEAELVEMYHASKSTVEFWQTQKVEKLEESQARPLLPFTIGQLGLILTSGCLDGIVDEGNGCCHAVKGRVVKKTETTENVDIENQQVFTTNTVSNRVEISVLLPDGTYKLLT